MTSYKNHNKISLFLLLLAATTLFYFIEFYQPIVFMWSYLFGLYFLSPDLDLKTSSVYKNWLVFRYLWWPFQKIMHHRGISHHYIVGPIVIISYFLILVSPILYFISFDILILYRDYFVIGILGCVNSMWVHIFVDKIVQF